MYGGTGAEGKFPMITSVSYDLDDESLVEEHSLYHEDNVVISNDATARGGLNVWIRQMPVVWGEWGEFNPCTTLCGGGTMTRSRICLHANYPIVDENCRGDSDERRICNTDACASAPTTCGCDDKSVVRCESYWCNKDEYCELISWFQKNPINKSGHNLILNGV